MLGRVDGFGRVPVEAEENTACEDNNMTITYTDVYMYLFPLTERKHTCAGTRSIS